MVNVGGVTKGNGLSVNIDKDPVTPSPTFCALPWMHVSTRPNGHMRTCCTANASGVQDKDSTKKTVSEAGVMRKDDGKPANLAHTPMLEAWNASYMRNVRKQMMNGEKPSSCIKCYKEEDAGHRSKRQWETAKWVDEIGLDEILIDYNYQTGEVPARVRYVDLRLGSKCQLACVMCSPHDSSSWVKEYRDIYPSLNNARLKSSMEWEKDSGKLAWSGGSYAWHKKNPEFFDELRTQFPYLKQLYWAGGESLIMKEHYEVLAEIIESGYASQIELRYNSNGLDWEPHLFDLWRKFKQVIFHFSIDSYGDINHFIRWPSPWRKIQRQLRELDNYPFGNLRLTTATTVTILSLYYLPDFIGWKVNQDWKLLNKFPAGAGMIDLHLAYWPPQLNIKALPKWFKMEVDEKFDQFYPYLEENWERMAQGQCSKEEWLELPYGINRLKGLMSFMNSEDWSERLPETAEWCFKVADNRGLDFLKIFPDLEWLEWYK